MLILLLVSLIQIEKIQEKFFFSKKMFFHADSAKTAKKWRKNGIFGTKRLPTPLHQISSNVFWPRKVSSNSINLFVTFRPCSMCIIMLIQAQLCKKQPKTLFFYIQRLHTSLHWTLSNVFQHKNISINIMKLLIYLMNCILCVIMLIYA